MKKYAHYLRKIRQHLTIVMFIVASLTLVGTQLYSNTAQALDQNDIDAIYQWPFWAPNSCDFSSSSIATINLQAAVAAATSANKGNTHVGFSLYTSTGVALENYNSTFENYGASITKSMLLVAYLNQYPDDNLSSTAITELTNMIEVSSNPAANWVYDHITNAATSVKAVATAAGMTGFKFNDTSDPTYVLGQTQITAQDFAKFFAHIDDDFSPDDQSFALGLLSNISSQDQNGLLKSGLPAPVYSKEGWKPENTGMEGAPYIVNQAAQFTLDGQTYGVAVTVGGTEDEASGEDIVQQIVKDLISGSSASGGTTATASDTTDIADSANAKEVFIYLTDNGFNAAQAAGIVGNLWIESKVIPTEQQVGGPAYGIAQWQDGRLDSMRSWTAANGMNANSVAGQQAFIMEELKTDYSNARAAVLQDSTPAAAAADWNKLYEQSADTTDDREEAANSAYQAFSSLAGSANTGAVASSADCQNTSSATSCTGSGTTATGTAEILCYAEKFQGIYYLWGGGHDGWSNFKAACITSNVINTAAKQSTAADPGPCATDCSGLVSMAVDWAFGQTFDWVVSDIQNDPSDWKSIPISQVQAGDVVTIGAGEHVEIVSSYDSATGTVHTFGSHYTGVTTGPTESPSSYWTGGAFRYVGPQ